MGTRNRERRAVNAKRRAKERARRAGGGPGEQPFEPLFSPSERVRALLGAVTLADRAGEDAHLRRVVTTLAALDGRIVDREAEAVLLSMVGQLWDNGWQPAEVLRHVRRADARSGRLVAMAVAADHARREPSTLCPQWAAQVDAAVLPEVGGAIGWLAVFALHEGVDRLGLMATVVTAAVALGGVGPLPCLLPPPGASGPCAGPGPAAMVDDPVLVKVRALLAQAESTTFEAEAAAFTAKAQELMARHAIDGAMVWARSRRDESPTTIRLPVDDPYADIKALLLQRVAHHSRCRGVHHDRYGLVSVVGFASDVAAAETLFTSLLVQAHTALRAEAAKAPPGGRTRSRSFRSSFLLSFTGRIDERLAEVNAFVESSAASEHGPALLPALSARSDVVDDAVTRMFGTLVSTVVRGGNDAVGWVRGRMAADQAHLEFGTLDPPVRAIGG